MRVRLFPMGGPPLTKDAQPIGWHVTLEEELPRGGTQLIFTWDGRTRASAMAKAWADLNEAFYRCSLLLGEELDRVMDDTGGE